jgi:CheY-like chemotaxis protein
MNILIIDDLEDDALLVEQNINQLVSDDGLYTDIVKLKTVYNETDALKEFRKCSPDLLLIDIHLPNNNEGAILAKDIIEEKNSDSKIILLSKDKNAIEEVYNDICSEISIVGFIEKPVSQNSEFTPFEQKSARLLLAIIKELCKNEIRKIYIKAIVKMMDSNNPIEDIYKFSKIPNSGISDCEEIKHSFINFYREKVVNSNIRKDISSYRVSIGLLFFFLFFTAIRIVFNNFLYIDIIFVIPIAGFIVEIAILYLQSVNLLKNNNLNIWKGGKDGLA